MKERNSNIEALRILSMFFIVMHHLIAHGVVENGSNTAYSVWKSGTMVNRVVSALYYPGGAVGVFIFFMISGYFLIDKTRTSIKKVLIEMYVYSWLMIPLFLIGRSQGRVFVNAGNTAGFFKLLLAPTAGYTWWFATCYIMLVLMAPMINGFIQKLTQKGYTLLLCFLFVGWYAFGSITDFVFFGLQKAIFYYLIGGYYKKYISRKRVNRSIALLIALISWFCFSVIVYYNFESGMLPLSLKMAQQLVALPICAISIFTFFETMSLCPVRWINMIASTMFAVYLLHDNFVLRDLIWINLFHVERQYSTVFFPITALLTTVTIIIVVYFVDMIRQYFEIKVTTKCEDVFVKINLVREKQTDAADV